MDIAKKVFILTLLVFAMLTVVFTLTYNLQLSNSLKLEQADTFQDLERVQNTVSTQQGYLDYLVRDWACWDETYRFIDDRNQEFIDVNVQNLTLAGIKVNVMVFVNNSGSIVYAKSVDIDTGEEKPLPQKLVRLAEDGTLLTKKENDTISGFVLLDEDPMFIASHPILTTKSEGPVKGTLIFGKYFDKNLLNSFEKETNSSLFMYRVDKNISPDLQSKLNFFSKYPDEIIIEPLNEEKIEGYLKIRDISGQPAFIIRADSPRDLYMQSKRTLNYVYFILFLSGLMTWIGLKFALDKLFISRLIGIDNFVTNVRLEGDRSQRLPLKDNDELYRLSREINGMLNEIYLTEQEYRKEQELKAQEREMKILLDSINELVVFLNSQLNIIWANKAALEYMQTNLQEIVGKYLKYTLNKNEPLSDYLQLEQIFITGKKELGEFTSSDGRIWFVQAIPVTDENGKNIGVLEICTDITERRKAEKLLQDKQIAELANRAKNEFLANTSHELRTPLNSIIGFSDLLYEQAPGELNEKQLKYVGNISKSGKQLLNLINGILDLAKIEAGKLELDYKEFNLFNKINTIRDLLSPIAEKKNIQIEFDIDEGIKDISADEDKFTQVIYNLVDNAIKYSYENSLVKIEARKKRDLVEITVKDTGVGVLPEDQNKLFKPFSQGGCFYSKEYQGAGLGLSLVKQIVHLHGGYVWFKSKYGEGSTFAFTIPINNNKGNSGYTE